MFEIWSDWPRVRFRAALIGLGLGSGLVFVRLVHSVFQTIFSKLWQATLFPEAKLADAGPVDPPRGRRLTVRGGTGCVEGGDEGLTKVSRRGLVRFDRSENKFALLGVIW